MSCMPWIQKSSASFFRSFHCSQVPLELLYTDAWGPSPVCSKSGFKYYVSFMDDYSVIHDFFQLCVRVMFSLFFFIFNRMLNDFLTPNLNQSNLSRVVNITFFNKFFKQQGISHRISCPHIHQQNGAIKHKHRHIVETDLSLLSHAYAPLKFWEDAFVTACYLINHMPTTTLLQNHILMFFLKHQQTTNF
jgi:hypothetical protein